MIALIQRVSRAQVAVDGPAGGPHWPRHPGVDRHRGRRYPQTGSQLLDRVLSYRIFADEAGKMNLNIGQISGELLLVPQFTLVADTHKGTGRGSRAGRRRKPPGLLFDQVVAAAAAQHPTGGSGVFGPTCRSNWSMTAP